MGQETPGLDSAPPMAVKDAKLVVKSARRAAKAAKASLRALKDDVKVARKHHKWVRKQLRAAEQALDQARAAAEAAAVGTAPKKPTRRRAPSKRQLAARGAAPGQALPPLRPRAALALSRPFRPVKLEQSVPLHAAQALMPTAPLPPSTPVPASVEQGSTEILPADIAR